MRGFILLAGALLMTMSASAQDSLATGPAVGKAIPSFSAVDQDGKTQSFETLKGPNGLLLLFHRSADW